MKTLAIASQKGGTAKTTTTAHLGAALAERGQKILLVDMDPQGHLAESFGVPAQELEQEISQVLEQKLSLDDIVHEVRPGLYLAPANIQLSYTETHLYSRLRREDRLKQALAQVDGGYDLALIDCPPSLGILTVNALSAADQVLIPMATEYFGMLGVALLLQTIGEMRAELNQDLTVMGVLATRVTRTHNAKEVLERTRADLGEDVRVFTVQIPETVRVKEAAALGKTIFEHAPDNPAATAYRMLAEEVSYYVR
jgi:chromosome partitioning protein